MQWIDREFLQGVDADAFRRMRPFPWSGFHGLLTPEGFARLSEDFPSLDLFEKHEGVAREHGQEPHDRYYLAYEESVYRKHGLAGKQGIVSHEGLPASWQRFLEELQDEEYLAFAARLFGVERLRVRYAWHVGLTGSSVSPHLDGPSKVGTHIFYFNSSREWNPAWGGETLVLGGRRVESMSPGFDDFESELPTPFLDNRSFLFQSTPEAWHGMRPLACPAGRQRRLFNVIFMWKRTRSEKLARKVRSLLGR